MLDSVLLNLRVLAGGVLVVAAVSKLLHLRQAAMAARLGRILPNRTVPLAIVIAALAEIACGAVITAAPFALTTRSAMIGGLGAVLTLYGIENVRRTGSCGCFGDRDTTTLRSLLWRNTLLFGCAALGALAGPDLDNLLYSNSATVATIPFALVVLGGIVLTTRLIHLQQGGMNEWRIMMERFSAVSESARRIA